MYLPSSKHEMQACKVSVPSSSPIPYAARVKKNITAKYVRGFILSWNEKRKFLKYFKFETFNHGEQGIYRQTKYIYVHLNVGNSSFENIFVFSFSSKSKETSFSNRKCFKN